MDSEAPTSVDAITWEAAWRHACEVCRFSSAALLALAYECEVDSDRLNMYQPVFPGLGQLVGGPADEIHWMNECLAAESLDAFTFAATFEIGGIVTVGQAMDTYTASYALFSEPHRGVWFQWYELTPRPDVMRELARLCGAIAMERQRPAA